MTVLSGDDGGEGDGDGGVEGVWYETHLVRDRRQRKRWRDDGDETRDDDGTTKMEVGGERDAFLVFF